MHRVNREENSRPAFTIVELLVVIAVIAILVAILIPTVQKVRAAAARAQCENNVKQLASALTNYEDAHKTYPQGTSFNYPGASTGVYHHGWVIDILPYIEQGAAFKKLNLSGVDTGWRNANFGSTLKDLTSDIFRCPLATVPKYGVYGAPANTQIARMTYVGIAGSVAHRTARHWNTTYLPPYPNQCTGVLSSTVSSGGVLPHDLAVKSINIKDGRSNTLMLGEQSDMCLDPSGRPLADCGSGPMIAAGYYHDGNLRLYNMTTIRGPLNDRSINAAGVCGYGAWQGSNNPLLSVHSGIVLAAFCDGSVRPLEQTLNVTTLRNLADIDDGNVNTLSQ